MKLFDAFLSFFRKPGSDKSVWLQGVKHSVKKFEKTYKLLEQYDKESVEDPSTLARAGRLQPYIRRIQKLN